MNKRILVCGGRDYGDANYVHVELGMRKPACVITGGCPTGADAHAYEWALRMKVPTMTVQANWAQYGRKAGPLRNQQMIDSAMADLVLAFPGGRGTADLVRRARKAGIPVEQVP